MAHLGPIAHLSWDDYTLCWPLAFLLLSPCSQNFELMQPDSSLDACALLGTMRDKDMGGLLSKLPPKKTGTPRARKIDDCMIHVPAMQ